MVKAANNLTKGTFTIPGMPSARTIVHWAFNAKKDEISNVFDLTSMYIVAKLVEIIPAGYLPYDLVKDYVKQQVINEKKGDYILQLIKQKHIPTNDLNSFAQAAKSQVITAQNVSFSAFAIFGVGYEPVIFGSLDLLKLNQPFGPLKGKNGVYLVAPTSINNPPQPTQAELQQTALNLTQGLRTRIGAEIFDKIKRDFEIKDYRTRFF